MEGDFTLVIAEKPDAARKIANALGAPTRQSLDAGMIEVASAFDGKSYVICSALGHLFEVGDPETNRSVFPVYDIDWFGKGRKLGRAGWGKNIRFQKLIQRRVEVIASVARKANAFVNACDYDIEGETIGANILDFVCGRPELVMRAKFSTLTQEDIRRAFSTLEPARNSLAQAGRIRHEVDFLWGVNLSRALTQSANKSESKFANVTIGRVQGPTLAFVVDREIERASHVPLPLWTITCTMKKNGDSFEATYKNSPIRNLSKAKSVFDAVSNSKRGTISNIQRFTEKLPPKYPFNIGELQKDAFYHFGITPSVALRIAEKLYLKALISYPRTDSQKLPPSIQPEKILHKLVSNHEYSNLIESLLSEPSRRKFPWQGPREDTAHPAIHPTGEIPKQSLSVEEKKIFDLVVRRFCNAFAPDAIVEKVRASLDILSNEFLAEWENIVDDGWMKYYPLKRPSHPKLNLELNVGEELEIDKTTMKERYTSPSPRYNEGSLLSKMESEGIGTKATRADTISTLIKRRYVRNSRDLVPDENALVLIYQLRKHCPEIVSPEMTRSLEKQLLSLQNEEEREEVVIAKELTAIRTALRNLMKMENFFWKRETPETKTKNLFLGKCPNCKTGNLEAIRSFRTKKRFIRCTNYQNNCKTSSPLPPRGIIKTTANQCNICWWPKITILYSKRLAVSETCSNFPCKSRESLLKEGH